MAAPGEKSFCVLQYHTSKSVVTVQRAFRAWYKRFNETGCLCKQKSSGCPLIAEDDVERVRASFVTRGTHIETSLVVKKKKKLFSVFRFAG